MAAVLPFEEALYRDAGIATTHVGHPLVESLDPPVARAAFLAELGWPGDQEFLALLPGSRDGEVARLAPPLLGAACALFEQRPGARAVVGAASPEHRARLERAVATLPCAAGSIAVVLDRTRETLAYARAAVVASGTATLECAALGTPLVAVYRLAASTHWLARRLVRLDRFALANIVAGEDVAPELLQDRVTPAHIVAALLPLWDEGPARTEALTRVGRVRALLGEPGASAKVAAIASRLVTGAV
jgi:lipid-A-disaccharide synthase